MEKGILQEWIVVAVFLLCVLGFTIGEAVWLSKKGWASFGKSLGFSVLTNVLGFSIGFFLLFVTFGIVIGMSWDGANKYPTGFSVALVSLGLAILFVPIFLTLCKRVFLSLLKIQSGKLAWFYSIISAVLGLTVPFGIPILLGYMLFR